MRRRGRVRRGRRSGEPIYLARVDHGLGVGPRCRPALSSALLIRLSISATLGALGLEIVRLRAFMASRLTTPVLIPASSQDLSFSRQAQSFDNAMSLTSGQRQTTPARPGASKVMARSSQSSGKQAVRWPPTPWAHEVEPKVLHLNGDDPRPRVPIDQRKTTHPPHPACHRSDKMRDGLLLQELRLAGHAMRAAGMIDGNGSRASRDRRARTGPGRPPNEGAVSRA